MLGQFLEFSVTARPISATLAFYRMLGFSMLPVSDILSTPYAAVSGSGVTLGLHEGDLDGPVPTFVRPQLSAYVRALRRAGVVLDFARLDADQFHQVGFCDPNDRPVVLLEARTHSPAISGGAAVCVCGEFSELSLHTRSVTQSRDFWQRLGCRVIEGDDTPWPSLRIRGHGITLGFHECTPFPPGLSFAAADLPARLDFLRAQGLAPVRGAPVASPARAAATLNAPDGLAIYMLDS